MTASAMSDEVRHRTPRGGHETRFCVTIAAVAAPSIRPLEAQDLEAVLRFWRRSREAAQPWLEERMAYRPEQDRAFFQEVLMPSSDIWVSVGPEGPAAFLALEGEQIEQLYVDPDVQGRGLGTALVDHAKGICPERLTLYTHQRNHKARRFYEWHGFRPIRFGVSPAPEIEPDVFYEWQAAKL